MNSFKILGLDFRDVLLFLLIKFMTSSTLCTFYPSLFLNKINKYTLIGNGYHQFLKLRGAVEAHNTTLGYPPRPHTGIHQHVPNRLFTYYCDSEFCCFFKILQSGRGVNSVLTTNLCFWPSSLKDRTFCLTANLFRLVERIIFKKNCQKWTFRSDFVKLG